MAKEQDIINGALNKADALLAGFNDKFFGPDKMPKTATEKIIQRVEKAITPRQDNGTTI